MFSENALQNYREVGFVIVMNPPLTPAKAINAHELEIHLDQIIGSGKLQVVIDCAGIDYIYSDTLNVLVRVTNRVRQVGGTIGLINASESIQGVVSNSLTNSFVLFGSEPEIMSFSMRNAPPEGVEVPAKEDPRALEVEPTKAPKPVVEQVPIEKSSPMEKAKIEAEEKMERRKLQKLKAAKQKKLKLAVILGLSLLVLAGALYLWQRPLIEQRLNELLPGLF